MRQYLEMAARAARSGCLKADSLAGRRVLPVVPRVYRALSPGVLLPLFVVMQKVVATDFVVRKHQRRQISAG